MAHLAHLVADTDVRSQLYSVLILQHALPGVHCVGVVVEGVALAMTVFRLVLVCVMISANPSPTHALFVVNSATTMSRSVFRNAGAFTRIALRIENCVICWNILAALHRRLICKWLGAAIVYKSS